MIRPLSELVYLDLNDLSCNSFEENCFNKERSISHALRVTIPDDVINPDIKYKECCYESLVLADNSNELHKNDYNGFFKTRQLPNESCDFVLIDKRTDTEFQITDNTYGDLKDFGDYPENPNLKTFVLDWSKVLSEIGEGVFQFKKSIGITGFSFDELSPVYTLKTYSDFIANHTIRIDVKFDSFIEGFNTNFKNTGFKSSLRIGGFFGRREPKHEQDNIVFRNKKIKPISLKQINEYQMQTELLPECITEQIFDLFLFADEIFMNDYNLNNHSYKFKNKAVKFEKNNSTKYYIENRNARINLIFVDRFSNKNKFNY